MKERNQSPPPDEQPSRTNIDLEILLAKVARALFEYYDAQDDVKEFARVDKLATAFNSLANDYVNETGRLHDDLGFELLEWATFKSESLESTVEQSSDTGITAEFVAEYREHPLKIIEWVERQLGITPATKQDGKQDETARKGDRDG